MEPENKKAAAEVKRLQPLAEAQREKLKEEMMGACEPCPQPSPLSNSQRRRCCTARAGIGGTARTCIHRPPIDPMDAGGKRVAGKLKDLGNSLLGNFGMSLDNFKAVKDPASGSYSISFQQ